MAKESFHLKSEHYGRRQRYTDKKREVKRDIRNKERGRKGKCSLKESTFAYLPMYHSENGVGVFNRRHLSLTSLPCLSLLPALKTLFSREHRTVDQMDKERNGRGFFFLL